MIPVLTWNADTAYVVLAQIQSPIVERGRSTGDRELTAEYFEQHRTTTRIWHDILRELNGISPTSDEQRELKDTALHVWHSYGSLLNMLEGVRVTTMENNPSTPSNKSCYWRIPGRCFSNLCPCSGVSRASHRLRVCRGCYRVLYCSAKCQAQ